MATLELDPLFTRALKLLHSKSKDSEYQLRQMVEDVIAQRKGHPVKHDLSELHSEPKKQRLDLFSTFEKEEKLSKEKDREAEKEKEKEKVRKERDQKDKDDKERKERIASEKAAAAAEKAAAATAAAAAWKASAKERESPDSSDDNMDTDGFAVDLGIACNVCQQFEVTSGNQLIECQECHNLYHQECHKPPVIGQDVNDPRFVWYCTRCVKNLEKMATKPPKPIKSSSSSSENSKSSLMSSSGSKSSRSDSLDIFPFRRVESKIPPSSLAAKPMSGLVGLAANLSGKTTSDVLSKSSLTKSEQTKHSSSSSSSSSKETKSSGSKLDLSEKTPFAAALMGTKPPTKAPSKTSSGIQMANADKRLQMMKKKAAAKLHEKRSFLK